MMAPLFDELDKIRERMETDRASWEPSKPPRHELIDTYIDWLEDLLYLAYVYGYDLAAGDLGLTDAQAPEDGMRETVHMLIDGEDFADRVERHMQTFDIDAVMRVAETETTRDYNAGGFEAAKEAQERTDRQVLKTWNTMMDERVRDTHSYLEGNTIGLDEAFFTFDGDSAMAPGGFILVENNANCRCSLTYSYADSD